MAKAVHTVSAAAFLAAAPDRVYRILSDYRNGHPRILPPQFTGLTVEKGGVGAGTVIRFRMRILGRTQLYRAAVTEPDPGRVLVETYLDTAPMSTSFTVTPASNGGSEVRMATEIPTRSGISGAIERFLVKRALLPIYREELRLLGEVAALRDAPTALKSRAW